MSEINPLQNYFRRPALYLKLPSGGHGYPKDAIDLPDNGEIPIYPMTAIDEITSRTPDALFNGVAVTELIKSCAPNIKEPWHTSQLDLDAILLAIKIASNGEKMEISTGCPSCSEESKYEINLTGLLGNYKPGNYNKTLDINDLKIKFKPLIFQKINQAGAAQFDVQYQLNRITSMEDSPERDKQSSVLIKSMNDLAREIVLESIEYVKTPNATVIDRNHIKEFLDNCDLKTYDSIRNYSIELKKSTETKPLQFTCIHCQHSYDQPFNINVSDFFG